MVIVKFYTFQNFDEHPRTPNARGHLQSEWRRNSSQIPGLVNIQNQMCEEQNHLDDTLGSHSCGVSSASETEWEDEVWSPSLTVCAPLYASCELRWL